MVEKLWSSRYLTRMASRHEERPVHWSWEVWPVWWALRSYPPRAIPHSQEIPRVCGSKPGVMSESVLCFTRSVSISYHIVISFGFGYLRGLLTWVRLESVHSIPRVRHWAQGLDRSQQRLFASQLTHGQNVNKFRRPVPVSSILGWKTVPSKASTHSMPNRSHLSHATLLASGMVIRVQRLFLTSFNMQVRHFFMLACISCRF